MRNKPKKSLGQNFLIDPNYQRKIISAIKDNYKGGTIMEIGPGRGALTQHLSEFAEELVLVEKDNRLVEELHERYSAHDNIRVVHEDFLKLDVKKITASPVVIGNLPYNIASQIYIKLLQNNHLFEHLFLMFQKEVATRCLAVPGNKDFGILTVWTQLFSTPKKLFDVPPNAFKPRPRVNSSFVRFDLKHEKYEQEKGLIEFVKTLFSQRRKKIRSRVKSRDSLSESVKNLIEKRPEELTIEEFKKVYSETYIKA